MSEYHVGCGAFGIYAGILNRKDKTLWQNKTEVTHEALCAVAQHLLLHEKEFRFRHKGKWYVMRVEEMTEGAEQDAD